jgi:alkaline phosphatase D
MWRKLIFSIVFVLFVCGRSAGQTPEILLSGPMASATGQDSTIIWLQTTQPATVSVKYRAVNQPDFLTSGLVHTQYDHLAQVVLRNLTPDTEYQYELLLNGKPYPLPYTCSFKTAPHTFDWKDFRFAAGSCAHVAGKAFDGITPFARPKKLNHDLYRHLTCHQPDFMLWLGDNVYLREDEREYLHAEGIRYRYKHARSLPDLQPFMGSTSHYAIWDDHDYGYDNSEHDFPLKDTSLKVFRQYFPASADTSVHFTGITGRMRWADVEFFMLDDRFYRNTQSNPSTMLGKAQIEWLKKQLKASDAPFKALLIGSEIFNFTHLGESVLVDFEKEIMDIFDYIVKEQITGVFVISGDRHYAEVNHYRPKGGYPIYEYCVSSLTSMPGLFLTWKRNPTRVGKLAYDKRNYGIFDVTGQTFEERKITLTIHNLKGKPVWKHEVKLSDLQFKTQPQKQDLKQAVGQDKALRAE